MWISAYKNKINSRTDLVSTDSSCGYTHLLKTTNLRILTRSQPQNYYPTHFEERLQQKYMFFEAIEARKSNSKSLNRLGVMTRTGTIACGFPFAYLPRPSTCNCGSCPAEFPVELEGIAVRLNIFSSTIFLSSTLHKKTQSAPAFATGYNRWFVVVA